MVSSNESNGMVMPVAPAYGGGGGFSNTFGGDWAWILLLLFGKLAEAMDTAVTDKERMAIENCIDNVSK